MNKKFVFLILNYKTVDETITCVESIIEKVKANYHIVIVDNGSHDNSVEVLNKNYKKNKKITILYSDENLGFANGNNLGFKYIKDNLNPDFIIMINNDTYMIIDNFCEIINKEYSKSKFSVLGPKILLPDNRIDNCYDNLPTIKTIKKDIRRNNLIRCFSFLYLYPVFKIFDSLFHKLKGTAKTPDKTKRKENVLLKGACLIFSKEYIKRFDGIDSRTFLFREEELLLCRLRKEGMLSVFNPDLVIFHNESVATKKNNKGYRKKWLFITKYMIKSDKILLSELKELETEAMNDKK